MSLLNADTYRDLVAVLKDRVKTVWVTRRAPGGIEESPVVDRGPIPMTLACQWTKLEDHLHLEMARARSVREMQDTATLHLDAAHYALDRIAVELVDVMPSITQIATVQPPRVYTSSDRGALQDPHQSQSIAA